MARADAAGDAYEELTDRYERVANVESAAGLLNWDQQVMMPDDGTPARSAQLSTLSAVSHEYLTDDRTGELLDELEGADLDAEQRAVVREIRHEHDRAAETRKEHDCGGDPRRSGVGFGCVIGGGHRML